MNYEGDNDVEEKIKPHDINLIKCKYIKLKILLLRRAWFYQTFRKVVYYILLQ